MEWDSGIKSFGRPPSRFWGNIVTRFLVSLAFLYVVFGVVVGIVEGWK